MSMTEEQNKKAPFLPTMLGPDVSPISGRRINIDLLRTKIWKLMVKYMQLIPKIH